MIDSGNCPPVRSAKRFGSPVTDDVTGLFLQHYIKKLSDIDAPVSLYRCLD